MRRLGSPLKLRISDLYTGLGKDLHVYMRAIVDESMHVFTHAKTAQERTCYARQVAPNVLGKRAGQASEPVKTRA
jgi:hypothetical protein